MVDNGAQPTRSIGDVPEGAPLQCGLDRHVGRKVDGRHAEASVVVDAALQDMRRPRPPAEPWRRAAATRPGRRGGSPDRVQLRRSRPRA
jgi:hypothetical protein